MGASIVPREHVNRFEAQLREVDPGFAGVLSRVPLQAGAPLPPAWVRCEMLERFDVLQCATFSGESRILEVGAGGHALTTVPLACRAGPRGRVVAVERERWTLFHQIVRAAQMDDRVLPVVADARRAPFRSDSFDLAWCVHGIRSLGNEATMVQIFREMLRVAPRILLAESLPIARNDAQRAHLAMYDLREEIFEARHGVRDDLHYPSLDRLLRLVERSGASSLESRVLEISLPHALGYLPRDYVRRIHDPQKREDLLRRWDEAYELGRLHGTDHPPSE